MRLYDGNIKELDSYNYTKWYSVKKHLVDRFKDFRWFVVPSTLKGIGKSYSIWNEIIIPDLIEKKLGAIYIRWTKDELEATIANFKVNPYELTDKLDCEVEWNKFRGVTLLTEKDTGRPLIYFVIPSQFKVLKGITIEGNLPLINVFWEEFLLPQGIYTKPKETLDSFWQLLGSIFRDQDFYIYMAANNTNPDNPLLWYVFTDMGWPSYGKTIADYDTGIVIDSPIFNDFLKRKYAKTTLSKLAGVNPEIKKQLFGLGTLNDSIYNNQDRIIYRLDRDVNFKFSFKIGIINYYVYTFQDNRNIYQIYITNQRSPFKIFWAGDLTTALETGLDMIPEDKIFSLKSYLTANKIWFRDVRSQNIIIDWLIRYRNYDKPIDWGKEKMKGG